AIASFGSFPKIIDTSDINSSMAISIRAGFGNKIIGNAEYTYVGFSNSLSDTATLQSFDMESGIGTVFSENALAGVTFIDVTSVFALNGIDTNVFGNAADNKMLTSEGSHLFLGREGMDSLLIEFEDMGLALDDFDIARQQDGVVTIVSGASDVNYDATTTSVERFHFIDEAGDTVQSVAFDIDGAAGQTYRLYQAAFDRTPDEGGFTYWLNTFDAGQVSLSDMAGFFIDSQEFQDRYGTPGSVNTADFITLLYNNVLDRAPDSDGFAFWLEQAALGASREDILVSFSESTENQANVFDDIADGIWYGMMG
ncbi:MAG: DUF4214 domain-containing protein, partial [Pseudomonadota bacterium]